MEMALSSVAEDLHSAMVDLDRFSGDGQSEARGVVLEFQDMALMMVNQPLMSVNPKQFWADLRDRLQHVPRGANLDALAGKLEVKFHSRQNVHFIMACPQDIRLQRLLAWIDMFCKQPGWTPQHMEMQVLGATITDPELLKEIGEDSHPVLFRELEKILHLIPGEYQHFARNFIMGSKERTSSSAAALPPGTDWRTVAAAAKSKEAEPAPLEKLPPAVAAFLAGTAPPNQQQQALVAQWQGQQDQKAHIEHAPEPEVPEDIDPFEDSTEAPPPPAEIGDPQKIAAAHRTIVALLTANSGILPVRNVEAFLQQAGFGHISPSDLGEDIFCEPFTVRLRGRGQEKDPLPPLPQGLQEPSKELKKKIVEAVKDYGEKIAVAELVRKLDWTERCARRIAHGKLRMVLTRIPEIFFEPRFVFLTSEANAYLQDAEDFDDGEGVGPIVQDPYVQLLGDLQKLLADTGGSEDAETVTALLRVVEANPKDVLQHLRGQIFWSHGEAQLEMVLRTRVGQAQHPDPLPEVYLPPEIRERIVREIKALGPKAKLEALVGRLGWNRTSELKKRYGPLRDILLKLSEVFYDPSRVYLKTAINNIVEWPSGCEPQPFDIGKAFQLPEEDHKHYAKKRKTKGMGGEGPLAIPLADTVSWAKPGVCVGVKKESQVKLPPEVLEHFKDAAIVGVLVNATSFRCTLRIGGTTQEVLLEDLMPLSPEVNENVLVVRGQFEGSMGQLVGKAGPSQGVVQIAGMNFQTISFSCLAAHKDPSSA